VSIEAGEVPANLLRELETEMRAARGRPQAEGHAAAILQIADLADVDREKAAEVLASIEAQPTVTRELLMRRIVEAWLEGQRRVRSTGVCWIAERSSVQCGYDTF